MRLHSERRNGQECTHDLFFKGGTVTLSSWFYISYTGTIVTVCLLECVYMQYKEAAVFYISDTNNENKGDLKFYSLIFKHS